MIIIINLIVCDISNVACFNKRNGLPKLEYIDLLFAIIPKEIEVVGIADCSLYHHIDEKKRYKEKFLIPKLIVEAPARSSADSFILTYALQNDAFILSNDRFRQYDFVSEQWLEEHRICFMILRGQLIFRHPLENMFKNSLKIKQEMHFDNDTNTKEKIEV